jgi:serine/threonine-protein kinase
MVPQEIGAKYEVRGTLGSGAMGIVYDAFDRLIERRVAIKVVRKPAGDDPESREAAARFRREAQAAGRLAHPSIVAVYDYGENAEQAWIVMELVEGGSLKGLLDRGERMAVPEIVRLMDQVLGALAFSHQRGVVHRDIKPANIMLTQDGQVKIADFGIARLENSSMTQVGTLMGTPSYMAPEQFRGETVDLRADIWAAGVVLYQLLTGEKPFEGGFSAVMHKALHTEPPPPSSLSVTAPRAFDAVVARALAKRPEDRFPFAAAFAEAVRAAAAPAGAAAGQALAAAPAGAAVALAGRGEDGGPGGGFGGVALPFADADATVVGPAGTATQRGIAAERSAVGGPAGTASGGGGGPTKPQPRGDASGGRRGRSTGLIAGGGVAALAVAGAAAWFFVVEPQQRAQEEQARIEREAREAQERTRLEQERLAREAALAAERERQEAAARQAGEAAAAAAATRAREEERLAREAAAGADRQPLAQERAAAEAAARDAAERERLARDRGERERLAREREAADAAARAAAERERQAAADAAEAERQRQAAAADAERQRLAQIQRPDLRAAAAAAAGAAPCSLVAAAADDNALTLAGVLRRGGEAAVQRELDSRAIPSAAARLRLEAFDGPYCDMLDALRPALAAPESTPLISIVGRMPLVKNQLLRFDIALPDWPSQLSVAYLMKSGEVAHLVPSQPQPAGGRVRFGEPRQGFPGWPVDEPFGTDLMLVVVSERPLFGAPRPVVEPLDSYAAALADALRTARREGWRVAVRPIVVETVKR